MSGATTVQRDEFLRLFGGVYEHSPWVAEQCFAAAAGVSSAPQLAEIFSACVDRADRATKLALIRAHPDLAGRAAVRGEMTPASSAEQRSAGIDQCSPDEYARFQQYNLLYKEKFGFPFVMAVRNSDRAQILEAYERRLANDAETEFGQALAEIHKIARLRLEQIFTEHPPA